VTRRFTVLAYLKCFVGLCKDRLEGLMASPRATLAAHCRTLALLVLLLSYDVSWVVLIRPPRLLNVPVWALALPAGQPHVLTLLPAPRSRYAEHRLVILYSDGVVKVVYLPDAVTVRSRQQVAYMSAFPTAPLAHVFLCLYDTAVVFLEACQALLKYGLHVSERWHAAQAERVRMIINRIIIFKKLRFSASWIDFPKVQL